jgi:hypothetical protein
MLVSAPGTLSGEKLQNSKTAVVPGRHRDDTDGDFVASARSGKHRGPPMGPLGPIPLCPYALLLAASITGRPRINRGTPFPGLLARSGRSHRRAWWAAAISAVPSDESAGGGAAPLWPVRPDCKDRASRWAIPFPRVSAIALRANALRGVEPLGCCHDEMACHACCSFEDALISAHSRLAPSARASTKRGPSAFSFALGPSDIQPLPCKK